MGPRLRRRLAWLEFWQVFEHPYLAMKRRHRRIIGQAMWRAYTHRRRGLYPDSVGDWEIT